MYRAILTWRRGIVLSSSQVTSSRRKHTETPVPRLSELHGGRFQLVFPVRTSSIASGNMRFFSFFLVYIAHQAHFCIRLMNGTYLSYAHCYFLSCDQALFRRCCQSNLAMYSIRSNIALTTVSYPDMTEQTALKSVGHRHVNSLQPREDILPLYLFLTNL